MKLKERILSCITAAAITIVGQCAFSGYAPEAFAEEELISGFFLSDFDPEIPLEELPVWSMDKDHTVTIKGITDSLYLSLYSFQIFVPLDEEEFSEDTDPFYEDDPISRYMMSFAAYDHDTFGLPEKIIFEAEADNLDIPPQTLLDGAIKEIVYPDTIKKITIQHNAFEETDITDLTSCSELKAEMRSFENCKFLNSVKCTGNSTFIGKNTFSGCTSMKTAELNNASIEEEAFKNCYLLKNVKITGDSVISDGAFVNCRSLENVDFDIEHTNIGMAFINCPNLKTINSKPVYDEATGELLPEYRDFILNNFSGSDNIGFVDDYIKAQVKKIVSENTTPGMNDVQKVRALHDWVCSKVTYDSDGESDYNKNHTDCSVFMNDSSVCEGYARALNLLLNEAGIETCFVDTGTHAWNIVKIGGHYFHVDSTWDDNDEGPVSHDWFMLSDEDMNAAGGDHANWRLTLPSKMHSFQTDTLPVCDLSIGDVNKDSRINIADLVSLNRYILKDEAILPEDEILTDLDRSGRTDSFDLCLMRQILL